MSNSFAILWTIACQAPLFMGLSQQEYCSGLPFPSPGYCPNQEIRLHLMHYGWNLHSWATGGTLHWGFSSVQSLSRVWLFDTPWTAACQASPSITSSRSLVKLMSIELVRYHLTILSSVLPFSSCLQSFPASGYFRMTLFKWPWLFSNESVLWIWWPKYWSFSFSISPSKEYSGLISFRMDWLDLLAVQSGLSRVFPNTTAQKHQFFGAQLSLWSNSHIHTWLLESP